MIEIPNHCPNHKERPRDYWIKNRDGLFVKVCYECYLKSKDGK